MGKVAHNADERRSFLRKLVSARVKLLHGSIGELVAHTRDVSDSGVFVEIHPVPNLPTGAHVKMQMLDSFMPQITFNMKVARTTVDGVGLMFVDYEVAGERFSMAVLRKQFKKK